MGIVLLPARCDFANRGGRPGLKPAEGSLFAVALDMVLDFVTYAVQGFLDFEVSMRKIILAIFGLALPTFAQDSVAAALADAGCGAPQTEFTVKLD